MTNATIKKGVPIIVRGVLMIVLAEVFAVILSIAYFCLSTLLYFVRSPAMVYFFPGWGRFAFAYYFMYLIFAVVACVLGFFFITQKGLKRQPKKIKILCFLAAAAIAFVVIISTFFFLLGNIVITGI